MAQFDRIYFDVWLSARKYFDAVSDKIRLVLIWAIELEFQIWIFFFIRGYQLTRTNCQIKFIAYRFLVNLRIRTIKQEPFAFFLFIIAKPLYFDFFLMKIGNFSDIWVTMKYCICFMEYDNLVSIAI